MLRAYRFTGPARLLPQLEQAMHSQGYQSSLLPFYEEGRGLLSEPIPLGSSLMSRFGYIYIQDPSSMLPALALARIAVMDGQLEQLNAAQADATGKPLLLTLDMCASPGGKTSLLARLLGKQALVLANEPSPKRLATLRRNLELMNQFNTGTISHQGQEIPLPSAGTTNFAGFDYILLDPPCSGWGTVEKNPQVMELWQGEKLGTLVGLQRLLLREAARLLKPGGAMVYSTCTTNVQENEEQVAWALNDLNHELDGALSLVPLEPFAGFDYDPPQPPLADAATLRVSLSSGMGQGFYLAGFRKGLDAPVLEPKIGGQNKKASRREPRQTGSIAHPVPTGAIASHLCDPSMLPPGELADLNGNINFYHEAGCNFLPEGFRWRGFPLGKPGRLDNGLRGLMPSLEDAQARGAAALNALEPDTVLRLISGQSLNLECSQPEVGLYLNGLPLCRLKARGGRVFI